MRRLALLAIGLFLASGAAAMGPAAAADVAMADVSNAADVFVLAANDPKKPAGKAKDAKGKPATAKPAPAPARAAPPPAPTPAPTQQQLAMDTSAPPMLRAQAMLAKMGYFTGKLDGEAGADMARAVFAYQAAQGLPQTARLDAATMGRLGLYKQ